MKRQMRAHTCDPNMYQPHNGCVCAGFSCVKSNCAFSIQNIRSSGFVSTKWKQKTRLEILLADLVSLFTKKIKSNNVHIRSSSACCWMLLLLWLRRVRSLRHSSQVEYPIRVFSRIAIMYTIHVYTRCANVCENECSRISFAWGLHVYGDADAQASGNYWV